MNILIIANYRTPNSGNFIASLLELGQKLRQENGDVVFLFPEHRNGGGYSWTNWLESEGFRVYLLHENTPESDVIAALSRITRQHNIQLIHSHFGLYHKILIKNGKKLGVKVLFHDHMDYVTDASLFRQKLNTTRNALVYTLAGVGVISVMEKKHKSYWCCRKRWYTPNGLSLRRNVPVELTREERRAALQITPEQKLCLFLGWDMYRKGLDIAIKAVAILRQTDPAWNLGIVGLGENPSQHAQDWISEHTGEDPRSPWIRYLPSTEDMFSYHRAADVYLSASRAEAFSYGILEAISQNTPVVVSDIEGTSWAQQYSKSVVYPVEDCHKCADTIQHAQLLRHNKSNYTKIIEQFNIDDWCYSVIEVYKKMTK